MFGSLLGKVVEVATLPIDIIDVAADVACGGDGSKKSRQHGDNPLIDIRDGIVKSCEELDD